MNALIVILAASIGFVFCAILVHLVYRAILKRRHILARFGDWMRYKHHILFPAFLVAMLASIGILCYTLYPGYAYQAAASPSSETAPLVSTTVIITGFAFLLTQVLLFVVPSFYREGARKATFITGHGKLEALWTIIPAVCFIGLFCWGQKYWAAIISDHDDDALTLEVVAQQFNWKCRYAGPDGKLGSASFRLVSADNPLGIDESDPASTDDFVPYQLHVPKGRQVNILLRSNDVIHSFYIPRFRVKMDAVPGLYTSLHFTPLYTTGEMRSMLNDDLFEYEIACAELCGRMHFAMQMILVVDSPADFEKWYRQQPAWLAGSKFTATQ